MRSARSFSCRALSSPETYSIFFSGSLRTVCSTRVDFPIPGSPPSKTSDPGTRPPPNTRFNSSSCISMRGSSPPVISLRMTGLLLTGSSPDTGRVPVAGLRTTSSTYVFHSPQEGHLPIHLGESCPQLLHIYTVFSFIQQRYGNISLFLSQILKSVFFFHFIALHTFPIIFVGQGSILAVHPLRGLYFITFGDRNTRLSGSRYILKFPIAQ